MKKEAGRPHTHSLTHFLTHFLTHVRTPVLDHFLTHTLTCEEALVMGICRLYPGTVDEDGMVQGPDKHPLRSGQNGTFRPRLVRQGDGQGHPTSNVALGDVTPGNVALTVTLSSIILKS